MIPSYAGMTMRELAIEPPLPPHVWVGSAVGIVPLELPLDRALPVNTTRRRRRAVALALALALALVLTAAVLLRKYQGLHACAVCAVYCMPQRESPRCAVVH